MLVADDAGPANIGEEPVGQTVGDALWQAGRVGHATAKDNDIRVEDIGDTRQAAGQPVRMPSHALGRRGIAVFSGGKDLARAQLAAMLARWSLIFILLV